MREYRVTRQYPYQLPDCPGKTDVSCRQGYYRYAESPEKARAQLAREFPDDVKQGFSFDVQDWGDAPSWILESSN